MKSLITSFQNPFRNRTAVLRKLAILGLLLTPLSWGVHGLSAQQQYGYDVEAQHIDTRDFFGFLQTEFAPWAFSYRLANWIYLPNPQTDIRTSHGTWFYAINGDTQSSSPQEGATAYGYPVTDGVIDTGPFLGYLNVTLAPWIYSYAFENWLYWEEPQHDFQTSHGAWTYLLNAPLQLRDVTSGAVTAVTAEILWESNGPARGQVHYGISPDELDNSSPLTLTAEFNTTVELRRLLYGTTYYYQVEISDSRGGEVMSDVHTFETEGLPPLEASWHDAWNSWDEPTMIAWYEENTGPGALGIEEADMWHPTTGGITINQTWLNTHLGNGHVYQEDGRWIVEALRVGWIQIDDNLPVTLRGCLVELTSAAPTGIRRSNTQATGALIKVEYCQARAAPGFNPAWGEVIRLIEGPRMEVRFTEVGPGAGGTGLRLWNNTVAEYNYVHTLGGHHSGIAIRGSNNISRRNYSSTGSSASIFIYAHDSGAPSTGLTNILVEENYLNSTNGWYAMNPGGSTNSKAQSSTHVRVLNNRWGEQCYWPGEQSDIGGSHHFWLGRIQTGHYRDDRNNEWGGNHWISTRNWIRPQTGQFAYDHPDDEFTDPYIYGVRGR